MECFVTKIVSICLLLSVSLVAGETCLSPQVKSEVYTTSEAHMSTDTVVIVTFSVQCANGVKDLNLYAEFNGHTLPASRIIDSDEYQVSISDEHKKLPSGTHTIRFFDEDLYTILRKAQRSGEDTSSVQSLFTIQVNHKGASSGPWINTEHVAAVVSLLVWYFAYTTRNQLQS